MSDAKFKLLLSDLAARLDAQLIGEGSVWITGINTIQDASPEEVCFLSSAKHLGKLSASRAAAVMVEKALPDCTMPQLVVGNVSKSLIAVLKWFAPQLTPQQGIHPRAVIEPTAKIDPTASIGPGAYIGHFVTIGPGTTIGPNCSIGEHSTIGAHSRLDANVTVYHRCKIGNFCVIQSNTTIGSVGFGYSFIDGRHQLIPHNGGVIIEDEVEIGANSCVDRAKFGNTIIGAGSKIDNLVQIAHNVILGRACLITGQVGIAGSAHLGDGVVMGGRSGVSDNVTVGSGTIAGVQAVIVHDTEPGQKLWGTPAINWHQQMRCVNVFQDLPEMARELKKLSKRVEQLESAKNNQVGM